MSLKVHLLKRWQGHGVDAEPDLSDGIAKMLLADGRAIPIGEPIPHREPTPAQMALHRARNPLPKKKVAPSDIPPVRRTFEDLEREAEDRGEKVLRLEPVGKSADGPPADKMMKSAPKRKTS